MFNLAVVKSVAFGMPQFIKNGAMLAGAFCKSHAPQIMLGVGLTAAAGGTVVACVQTLKMPEVVEKTREASKEINGKVGNVKISEQLSTGEIATRDYDINDAEKELTKLYFKTAGDVIKIYWGPVILVIGGFTLIGLSHGVMSKRLVAATAAYEGANQLLEQYRKKVIDAEGRDADSKYMREAIKDIKDTKFTSDEPSEGHHLKKWDPREDPTLRIFDEVSSNLWRPAPIMNLATIKNAQETCNRTLEKRYRDCGVGFLYLWEAEIACGLIPSPDSFTLGWLYEPGKGYGQIDFGLYKPDQVDFLRCKCTDVLLEFNCVEDLQEIITTHYAIIGPDTV